MRKSLHPQIPGTIAQYTGLIEPRTNARRCWYLQTSKQSATSIALRFKAIYVIAIFLAIPSLVFAQATVSIQPLEMESPAIGEEFSVDVAISNGANITAYQVTVEFNPKTLAFADTANADYLPAGAFVVPPVIADNNVTLAAASLAGASDGNGTLATITFAVIDANPSTIKLTKVILSDPDANQLSVITTNGQITGPVAMNEAPVAIIEATPAKVVTDQTISLSGVNSLDDSGIKHYVWHFGDGSSTEEKETVTHVYKQPGNYTVTLTVTDDGAPPLKDEAMFVITVTDKKLAVHQQRKQITSWGQLKIRK